MIQIQSMQCKPLNCNTGDSDSAIIQGREEAASNLMVAPSLATARGGRPGP